MTTIQQLLFSGIALGSLGGCATQHTVDGGVMQHFEGTIDYERTGGFINTRTSLHIEPGGETRWVKPDGSTTTSTLSQATMADLKQKVDQAQFPMLATEYHCSCNDDFVHTIKVDISDTSYTVVVDDMANYPARLRPLIDALSNMSKATLTD